MKIWNYIGEFFLFRWLFGSHKHKEARRDVSDRLMGHAEGDCLDDTGFCSGHRNRYDSGYSRHDNQNHGYSHSDDYFLEEDDDYDVTDYDITDDDFLDDHDDYDMMDDDF